MLPSASLYSLGDFHVVFYKHFRESYSFAPFVENCCENFQSFILHLESLYGDEEVMDEEIREAWCKTPFHHREATIVADSWHDTQERVQSIVSPLDENEEFQPTIFSSLVESAPNSDVDDESRVPPLEFNMDSLVLNDQGMSMGSHPELSVDQDHDCANQREEEKEEDVELTIEEETEEGERADPSLFVNNEDVEKSPVTALQYHQTQQVEQ